MLQPVLNTDELNEFLDREFPQMGGRLNVLSVKANYAQIRMSIGEDNLRPGGTVSGPTMFTLADCAYYLVTLAMIGPVALAVTTSCSINFMRKPEPSDLIADARILKLGRTLSVGDVLIYNEGKPDPVAHASLTYSIPPKR